MLSYDKYIEYLIKDGEFDHKVNQPFKSFVSGLLDLTIIKPIIEAYTGTDLITGEDLTDLERGLKGVGAVIDILTLGQAMTIAKGAEAGISKMLKTVAVEGLSNVAGYTAAEISNAYDMPPLVSMIVSLGAGITASKVGCKYIIKDSSGKVIQEISEEVARNIDNTSNTTSIKENILKNVEESRIAREASGYKSFVEFESGASKGGGKADTDIPSAFKQKEFASSYEARITQTPADVNIKVGFEGNRGESLCSLKPPPDPELKQILDQAGINGIQYKNGVPDFSPVSKAEVEINYMLGGKGVNGTKARNLNFEQANIELAKQLNKSPELASKFGMVAGNIKAYDIEKYRIKNNLTWHELNDTKIMQLVPTKINSTFGHLGGVGEINAGAYKID